MLTWLRGGVSAADPHHCADGQAHFPADHGKEEWPAGQARRPAAAEKRMTSWAREEEEEGSQRARKDHCLEVDGRSMVYLVVVHLWW